jgi:hypothetical protein
MIPLQDVTVILLQTLDDGTIADSQVRKASRIAQCGTNLGMVDSHPLWVHIADHMMRTLFSKLKLQIID